RIRKPADSDSLRSDATYCYDDATHTRIRLAGFNPNPTSCSDQTAPTWARKVTFDDQGRITDDTGPTGLNPHTVWHAQGHAIAATVPDATDTNGLMTSYAYDTSGNRTDVWGPARAGWFDSSYRPTSGHTADVPHTTTSYDDGLTGLAATWWTNPNLVGAPI